MNVDEQESVPSWEQMRDWVNAGQLHRLVRGRDQIAAYKEHRAQVLKNWKSMDDFILHGIFGYPASYDQSCHQFCVVGSDKISQPAVPTETGRLNVRFTANRFPYRKPTYVQQNLLWSTKALSKEQIEILLEIERPSQHWENIWWVSPPELRSVHGVFHVHVMSRARVWTE